MAEVLSQIEQESQEPIDDHEHVVDIERPDIKGKIEASKKLFREFLRDYGEKFDLPSEEGINETLEAAHERGIFEEAQRIRELIYDKNISIYGVSYLSNVCNQNCGFCPMGVCNKAVYDLRLRLMNEDLSPEERADFQRQIEEYEASLKTMSPEEAKADYAALAEIGHREICVLSGEKISADIGKVIDYVQLAVDTPGVKEVILNLGVYNYEVFKMIRQNLNVPAGVRLQHRVFQETYDWDEYGRFTKDAPESRDVRALTKKYPIERHMSQGEALRAGFDEVGIGALFGLTKYPIKEIEGLQSHTGSIQRIHGKEPKRCCLPLGNEPEYVKVDIPYMIPGVAKATEITELIYALARLAMPTVSIVSSERDGPEILKILDKYANHTTLFVHPGPGRNIESLEEFKRGEKVESRVVEQAATVARDPKKTIQDWLNKGYHILDFNWQKYV